MSDNDEARMTNDEANMKRERITQDRQLHSFVIRHSSFVISATGILLAAMLVLGGCSDKRITKANVDEVAENMSKKQVESILGPPTSIDNKDFIVMKKTTYVYRQGKETVTIVFKDDKVQEKNSTLSE